jgi:SAM-dependent methyltransferase
MYFCNDCDIFYRQVDEANLVEHYYAASYIQEKNEPELWDIRIHFFEYVISLVKKYINRKSKNEEHNLVLMDFGSSYGHLIELANNFGIRAMGVELNEDLIASCKKKGLNVYKHITELQEKVDAVTSIDSLYCVPNPKDVLADIKNCLKPNGIFVARLTNRNLYARLRARFIRKGDYSTLGDASVSYSLKGVRKLLSLSGFQIIKVIPDYSKGKKLAFTKSLCYWFSYIPTLLTGKRIVLTPGFLIIAKLK